MEPTWLTDNEIAALRTAALSEKVTGSYARANELLAIIEAHSEPQSCQDLAIHVIAHPNCRREAGHGGPHEWHTSNGDTSVQWVSRNE